MMKLNVIRTLADWEKFKTDKPSDGQLIIFKRSPICPTSISQEEIFDEWMDDLPDEEELSIVKVDVIAARPVSQQIANELNIDHQSPQVIWLDQQWKVLWSASHYQITRDKLEKCRLTIRKGQ